MSRTVPLRKKRGAKRRLKGDPETMTREQFEALELERRVALIQDLIPLGLMAASEELQREVCELAGLRYGRKHEGGQGAAYRFGTNRGTVLLGGQRVPIDVPRVRSEEGELRLRSYELLHRGVAAADERLMERLVGEGVSCRTYERNVDTRDGAIGTSKSTVSKSFVAASAKVLREFRDRNLKDDNIVAVFIDGKYFAKDEIVMAVGVTIDGHKRVLGFVQTGTENGAVISAFLRSLLDRGLAVERGILVCIDGSKGFRSAVRSVLGKTAVVQRCQWHKRENIVSYLPKSDQHAMRRRLQLAYERPTYKEAKRALGRIRSDLEDQNQSALGSLDEGLEESLTLHRLGVFAKLGKSFKTTNCIESVNSMAEGLCGKVRRWTSSSQKQRWLASALREIEPRLNRVQGYKQLHALRHALAQDLGIAIDAKDADRKARG